MNRANRAEGPAPPKPGRRRAGSWYTVGQVEDSFLL